MRARDMRACMFFRSALCLWGRPAPPRTAGRRPAAATTSWPPAVAVSGLRRSPRSHGSPRQRPPLPRRTRCRRGSRESFHCGRIQRDLWQRGESRFRRPNRLSRHGSVGERHARAPCRRSACRE